MAAISAACAGCLRISMDRCLWGDAEAAQYRLGREAIMISAPAPSTPRASFPRDCLRTSCRHWTVLPIRPLCWRPTSIPRGTDDAVQLEECLGSSGVGGAPKPPADRFRPHIRFSWGPSLLAGHDLVMVDGAPEFRYHRCRPATNCRTAARCCRSPAIRNSCNDTKRGRQPLYAASGLHTSTR